MSSRESSYGSAMLYAFLILFGIVRLPLVHAVAAAYLVVLLFDFIGGRRSFFPALT